MGTRIRMLLAATAVLASGGCAGDTGSPAGAEQESSCDDIVAFAERIRDTGIAYDYQPSEGPAQLAEWADVVLAGDLTGEADVEGEWIGYELTDVRVLAGDAELQGTTATVAVEYGSHHDPASDHIDAIPPGAPVIAFVNVADEVPGGLIAWMPEGFLTGCEGQPPVGWVGEFDRWTEMGSLDDVEVEVMDVDG